MKKKEVVVLIGAGLIGLAIARRISVGKHLVIADYSQKNIDNVRELLENSGYETSGMVTDISSKESIKNLVKFAQEKGEVKNLIQAAGVSPSQASIQRILEVDLYGTAVILEEFGNIIKEGGSGVVISSQSGHRLPALTEKEDRELATASVDELLNLDIVKNIKDTLHAYQISKRGNSLRVKAEANHWTERGARINTISPGIIMTPLAKDELTGERAEFYQNMLANIPAGRVGIADEIAELADLLMSDRGSFITGSDFLIDGGATASYFYRKLQPKK
ncbi:SDR family oxidoreductase [Fusobacterium simiae]|uniref:SDR family oxidoreductase n=1 Tax=Fusobacterium TaxID=848 RepID=UPI00041543E9|nr:MULTISPECIES: SDR family oxidoreductase [Fusobacterium]MDC7954932.1 SDR family oxidoreductase [Fusobacterium simiae]